MASLTLTRTLPQYICIGFKKHVATQNTEHALAQSLLETGNAAAEDPSHIPHTHYSFSPTDASAWLHTLSRSTELPCDLVDPFPISSPTSQKPQWTPGIKMPPSLLLLFPRSAAPGRPRSRAKKANLSWTQVGGQTMLTDHMKTEDRMGLTAGKNWKNVLRAKWLKTLKTNSWLMNLNTPQLLKQPRTTLAKVGHDLLSPDILNRKLLLRNTSTARVIWITNSLRDLKMQL